MKEEKNVAKFSAHKNCPCQIIRDGEICIDPVGLRLHLVGFFPLSSDSPVGRISRGNVWSVKIEEFTIQIVVC